MRRRHSHLAVLAVLASCKMLLLSSTAMGQTVQIFDEAPSIEQLRSIMIPESHGGAGRTIVLQHSDVTQKPDATQLVNVPMPSAEATQPAQPETLPPLAKVTREQTAGQSLPPIPQPGMRPPGTRAPNLQAKMVALTNESAIKDAVLDRKPDNGTASAGIVGFRINFALDSAVLPSASHAAVDRIAELLKQEPGLKLRIEGHTDALGGKDYNFHLSRRRALAVAEYLVLQQGVEPDRLALVGKGMTEPMTNDPFDPRNRRVQFVRID